MNENIIASDIAEKVATSFLSYANYVIVDRAVPNANDGLKPVQRRILYAMHGLGLRASGSYKKCARVTGETLGKYHPHGDTSVYEALVKMAQDFNMRYPLISGHGNFGTTDGDSPAAMRYTEAKLSPVGELMLKDIEKNTIDMHPNFDESESEPIVLPTYFPSILCNGCMGIAVGLASSMAPHYAPDIYKALDHILSCAIELKEADIEDLIAIVKAPDFPTGGIIVNKEAVKEAYRSGKGKIVIRSKYTVEEEKGHQQIVFTEIPYKLNKKNLVIAIYEFAKTVDKIKEVRDESNKEGTRIVIELKNGANIPWIVNNLFKKTQLQANFSINNVAIVNNKPVENLSLKDLLEIFILHASQVLTRKINFELDKMKTRVPIVEAIVTCLNDIDNVINIIKTSQTNEEIITKLSTEYNLSEIQAKAISDMRLKTLSMASIKEYTDELTILNENITREQSVLDDNILFFKRLQHELNEVSQLFSKDVRKTEIADVVYDIDDERELVVNNKCVITFTANGIIKSVNEADYNTSGRRTKGVKSANMRDDDIIKSVLTANSKDDLLFFTTTGRCHILPVYKIPISNRASIGKYVNNYLSLEDNEKIVTMINVTANTKDVDLFLVTKKGIGKRLNISQLSKKRSITKVISFKENDELADCILVKNDDNVLIVNSAGKATRIDINTIRCSGKTAMGVKVMSSKNDKNNVVSVITVDNSKSLLIMTKNGLCKRTEFKNFNVHGRGGMGSTICGISTKTGSVISALAVSEDDDLFIASKLGQLSRIEIKDIRILGRTASGVMTINLKDNDYVASISNNKANAVNE